MSTRIFLDEAPLRLLAEATAAEPVTLPLDLSSLLDSGLQLFPPSERALESAIALIEDALMPCIPALRRYPLDLLRCEGAFMPQLGDAAGCASGTGTVQLSIDALERVFNRIADVAAGIPARSVQIPQSPGLVVTVLLLREIMHHVGYPQLEVAPAAQPD